MRTMAFVIQSQRVNIKRAEASLLSEIEAPCLATIEQHAEYACLIDCNFGVQSKLSVFQGSRVVAYIIYKNINNIY